MKNVNDIREMFKEMLANEEFVTDKSGCKTLEIIGESYLVDEDTIFGTLNKDYAEREIKWYMSGSLNVNDIPGGAPTIWKQVASPEGKINSNYGWCVFSAENGFQFLNVIKELKNNPNSRRAQMIYTRPSMWDDYNADGMSDFMCTTSVQCFIRKNKLVYIINQRSCDAVYGFKNDIHWHKFMQNHIVNTLRQTYPDLEIGDMIHQVGSLHLYERHFKLI